MPYPFIGEIQMFAGKTPPYNWALCNGQMLNISEYQALHSLLGTVYGGDGVTTFGLPDLRGRIPLHMGQGPGLSPRTLGETGGVEEVSLSTEEIAAHTHTWRAYSGDATSTSPVAGSLAKAGANYYTTQTDNVLDMSSDMVGSTGGSHPHNNMMPTLFVHFIICLIGTYPTR